MTLEHLDTVISFVVILTGVSLFVTTLTQMVSALLGLRGTNLRWGIKTLLEEIDPNLGTHAAAISQAVLHHPLISDSTLSRFDVGLIRRWKLASTVRKEELIEILHKLAETPKPKETGQAPDTWLTPLRSALERLDREPAENLVLAAPEIKKLFPNDPAAAERVITQMMASVEHLSGGINQWFDSVMDRVSQRFSVHARIWTIVFSLVVAFALHLDAFKLLTQLSSDAELRARLVTSADTLSKKADEMLVTSSNAPSAVYVAAMQQLVNAHPRELASVGQPSGFSSLDGGKQWLEGRLKAAKIQDPEKWLKLYEELVPQAALRTAADDFHSILTNKLKFQLIPDPYPTPFYNYWTPSWLHLWGILATAALLSLGAPFWFNVLKNLSSLRPVLAKKEAESAEKKGEG
jgi:hypothetical protein